MFVRWKKKFNKDGKNYMLTATLVENFRDGNRIRQRHLLNIGSISTMIRPWIRDAKWNTFDGKAITFWHHAMDKVHFYEGMTPELQEKIKVAIAEKVPYPAEKDMYWSRRFYLETVRESFKPEWVAKYEDWYKECGVECLPGRERITTKEERDRLPYGPYYSQEPHSL